MSRCLITGCELIVHGQKWCHGDLHLCGGCYVFNACLYGMPRDTAWAYKDFPGEDRMILRVNGDYFERRGVIVVPIPESLLNAKAQAYLDTPVSWVDSVLGSPAHKSED